MKHKHQLGSIVSVAIILLATLTNTLFALGTVSAETLPVVLNNDQITVRSASVVSAEQIDWTIEYEKPVGRAAFQVTDSATNQPLTLSEGNDLAAGSDGWFVENQTVAPQTGTIHFSTPLAANQLQLAVKLTDTDEQNQETVLFATETPVELVATVPEVTASSTEATQESSTAVVVATTETESSATAEAPAVTDTEESSAVPQVTQASAAPTVASEQPAAQLAVMPAAALLAVPASGSLSPADPFGYTENALGKFPTYATNAYSNSATSDFIRNYAFQQSRTEGNATTRNIYSSGALTFDNGYHDYGDALLKKTVKPTSDPNQFDIQLDLIGKALEKRQKVDIVLVVDKSSSMNSSLSGGTRWSNARTAVNSFADSLLNTSDDTIRLALTSFGSNSDTPFSDIAKFANNSYFTNNPQTFKTHSLLTTNPDNDSGTPTYLGLDAGYALATNTQFGSRADAAKVVIVLTDGEPTFAPNNNYQGLTNRVLDLPLDANASRDRYTAKRINTNYYSGNGNDSEANATIAYVNTRNAQPAFQNIVKYSIGYIIGTNTVLSTIGVNGAYTANNGQQLTTVLSNLSTIFTATLQNATLTDPLSPYVEAIGSPTLSALTLTASYLAVTAESSGNYPSYASQIQKAFSASGVTLQNINLGGSSTQREGIRITYRVQLKEAYRDGLFYQANGTTFVKNQLNQADSYYHFAVPSVRAPAQTVNVQVKKTWQDEQNKWGLRKEIKFQLQSKVGAAAWSDVANQSVTFAGDSTNWTYTFTNLPSYQAGTTISYRVVETAEDKPAVPGYEPPVYAPESTTGGTINVTNQLKTIDVNLKKVQADGQTPLSGAKFGLYRTALTETLVQEATAAAEGTFAFTALPIGKYVIKETTAPNGYQKAADIAIEVVQNEQGALVVQGLPTDGKIINQLKDFAFELLKVSKTGTGLKDAVFELSGNGIAPQQATSTAAGLVKFTQGLRPGQYTLKELQAPTGYAGSQQSWTVTIGNDQQVTIKDSHQQVVYQQKAIFDTTTDRWQIHDFQLINELNDFTLKVTKQDQAGQELNGAMFELTGPNDYRQILVGTNQALFTFTGLRPGTYTLKETQTPEGYLALKDAVTILIDEAGAVTIDGELIPSVLAEGNVIKLTVTNEAVVPLPQTGSIGLLPFIFTGFALILGFGLPLLRRRVGGGRNEK